MIGREAKFSNIVNVWIIVYTLSTFIFFAPVFISLNILKAISWFCIIITFGLTFKNIAFSKIKDSRYAQLLKLIILMIILSVVSSLYIHGQELSFGGRAILMMLPYSFFFFLHKYRVTSQKLEKMIWILLGIHLIAYFAAVLAAPQILFDVSGNETELNESRGIARVSIAGACLVHLCFFMSVNKWLITKRSKFLWLAIFLFSIILLKVSRQHIIFSLLLGVYMVLTNIKWYFKILILTLLFVIISVLVSNIDLIQNLIKLSQDQVKADGLENIRIQAFKYYFLDYNTNIYQIIFGNGIPHLASTWGKNFQFFMQTTGLVPSDVGYAKIFFYWGIVGLFLFSVLSIKVLTQRVSPELSYCKFYMIFIIFTNIGSHSFFTEIITLTFVLYILDLKHRGRLNRKYPKKFKKFSEPVWYVSQSIP